VTEIGLRLIYGLYNRACVIRVQTAWVYPNNKFVVLFYFF